MGRLVDLDAAPILTVIMTTFKYSFDMLSYSYHFITKPLYEHVTLTDGIATANQLA